MKIIMWIGCVFSVVLIFFNFSEEQTKNIVKAENIKSSQIRPPIPPKGTPEWTVYMFFIEPNPPNLNSYYTSEMLKHHSNDSTIGSGIPTSVSITYRKLWDDSNRAMFTVFFRDSVNSIDWYCYLRKESERWKLVAVRSLAMTGVIYGAISELESKNPLPDSEKIELANMKLTIACDSALKVHFLKNQETFSKLVDVAKLLKISDSLPITDKRRLNKGYFERLDSLDADISRLAQTAAVSSPSHDYDILCPGQITIMIGGMLDNTVGYMYIPDSCEVPVAWPNEETEGSHMIYIERITPGWYVFKMT